jgi:hypothetical protein
MTLGTTPEEMLQYATKFEFSPTKHMRLSIEKCQDSDDEWVIKNIGTEIFDRTQGKLLFHRVTDGIPECCRYSIEDAFYYADWLIQKEKEDEINYTGRCRRCGKYVGEDKLLEAFGWNFCQKCYDEID